MKAVLVEDVLELSQNSKRSAYPKKPGTYLVDDGVSYMVVTIHEADAPEYIPFGFIIPRRSVVKEYERIGERDIDLLQKQLAELNKQQKDTQATLVQHSEAQMRNFKTLDSKMQKGSKEATQQLDLKDLTKLVAVAQKPELIK